MEYYSAIKKKTSESIIMRWMRLEPIIKSEVSHKEKYQYSINSVQFISVTQSCPILCDHHEPQHARPPCSSPAPGVHSNTCPLSQ